ncbi:MAG TPA: TIGR04255 family protein [Solirubrobacteraceae bacterium]
MPIRVPKATLSHLESAPLKVAVAQVRYSPVHAVGNRDLVSEFESRLDRRYVPDNPQAAQTFTIHIGPGAASAPPAPSVTADTVWPFKDDARGYAVSLGHASIAVEAGPRYHAFPQFLEEFSNAIRACDDIFHPKHELRLGLRYVNEITDERLRDDIRSIINPKLVVPVGTVVKGGLQRSFGELRVEESLGTVVIRHGLVEDTTYLLDFDYFSTTEREFDPPRLIETVQSFHDLIEPLFVWTLTRGYLAELKQQREGRNAT